MLHRNVENFIGCDSSYRTAGIVLYGAPFDSTTSYRPGARFGPAAIRHESYGLETYSPYQDKDLTDCNVFDSGDLELCFGSSESALVDIESRAAEILRDGKLPLLLGGEHLVTLGAVRAAVKKYPDLHIVHFDAHADLRDDYLGAQAEQFSFYRIPKALFTEPNFRELSTDAKVLYGILLDRMSLSLKNQWLDAQNKVYIIFTVDEIMDALNCANQKATRLMVELEKQAGLVERKRQGLGRPNLIYVKNFAATINGKSCEKGDS